MRARSEFLKMSQQGPILVVSTARRPSFAAALDVGRLFPVVETEWADAARAVEQVQPAAVLAATADIDAAGLAPLAARVAARQPYLPLIAVDPQIALPDNAIPFFQNQIPQPQSSPTQGGSDRLMARLRAALRVRSLHATVMRRLVPATPMALSHIDPARDATVLLIGRGGAYPTLSVSLGERTGVVGALSIEAAAKHLNVSDIDGIVLGEGFSPRVIDAFLTVLTEDARFRNLPVVVTGADLAPAYDLPNLEIVSGDRRAGRCDGAAADPPARLRGASEPHAEGDRRRWPDRRADRPAHPGGLRARLRQRRLSDAAARRRIVGCTLCVRSRTSPRAIRRRADHQPPDAANGFRRRPGRRLGRRRLRRDRPEDGAHHRAATVERDAPYQPRHARRTIGTGRDGRNADAERFREVAAVAAPGRRASRRVVNVPCDLTGTTILILHCRSSILHWRTI